MHHLRSLKYLSSYTIPLVLVLSINKGSWMAWFPLIFVFGIIPLLELIAGRDPENLNSEAEEKAKKSLIYSLILWMYLPLQWAITVWVFSLLIQSSDLVFWTGALLSLGVSNGGVGITIAHELVHRKSKAEQWVGKLILLGVSYTHFSIEHVYGHHKMVATPHDPATARLGESVYSFWNRSVREQLISAWNIEKQRLQKSKKPVLGIHNSMLWFGILSFMIVIGFGIWSPVLAFAFIVQSVVAFTLLEAVNYIEHYGLQRIERKPGKYEAVNEEHSWNSDHIVSRYLLFELTRHSDHHAHAMRKYQTLRSFDTSPQLPTGYPGMIVLALVPPLWFRVMNNRALEYRSLSLG